MRILALTVTLLLTGCGNGRNEAPVNASSGAGVPAESATTTAAIPDSSIASTPESAVGAYYDAIDRRDFAAAWRMWQGDGAASGKSLVEFSTGFQGTRDVRVSIQPTDPLPASSDTAVIPVTVLAELKTDEQIEYTGTYTLARPAENSGAWRILSADLSIVPVEMPTTTATEIAVSRNP